jgi:4-diphosphocytidyl-2-C-methyl-D-erythritol kinase
VADAHGEVARDAPAKLNLFLRVLRSREDGYHDMESLLMPITLADTVTARGATALRVDVRGPDHLRSAVSAGGMNLALVAALALGDACNARGAIVDIDKRIPVAAGLGGGSADAAATLHVLNALWDCGLDLETLLEAASRIGSDVPALVLGGPVLVSGRGERLEPADVAPTWWVVMPFDFPTRSPDAFRWWDERGGRTGPDPAPLLAAAAAGDIGELGSLLFNDLEEPVVRHHPEIGEMKRRLLEAGTLGAMMSGSGPTVVALARSELHAREVAEGFAGSIVASAPA